MNISIWGKENYFEMFRKQLQILLICSLFKGLPRLMIPMFWFRQSAEITEDLAKSVYWASKAKYIGTYFAYALGGLAFLIIMVAVYISFAKKWAPRHGDDDELLTDSIN